jgi:hypothetical protein
VVAGPERDEERRHAGRSSESRAWTPANVRLTAAFAYALAAGYAQASEGGASLFDARNRLEGDSIFLDLAMPIWVKTPPGGHP